MKLAGIPVYVHVLMQAVLASVVVVGTLGSCGRLLAGENEPAWSAAGFLTKSMNKSTVGQRSVPASPRFQLFDLDSSVKRVEIALVVDGTTSMKRHVQDLSEVLKDMHDRLRRGNVEVKLALVVYRDFLSASGAVHMHRGSGGDHFVSAEDAVTSLLASIQQLEEGAPYFREMVDRGLYHALDDLDWTPDSTTARWIWLIGDAPPYPEGFTEPSEDGRMIDRKHTTAELIERAKHQGVQIHSILCASDFSRFDREQRRQLRDEVKEAAEFMSELARGTDGKFIDLEQSDGVGYWLQLWNMPPITKEDIEERVRVGQAVSSANRPLRVGVLPHVAFDKLHNPEREAERIVTAITTRLNNSVQGIHSVNWREWRDLQLDFEADTEATIRSIAKHANADFVIWGRQRRRYDKLQLSTGLYRKDGSLVDEAGHEAGVAGGTGLDELAGETLLRLLRSAGRRLRSSGDAQDRSAGNTLNLVESRDSMADEVRRPIAKDWRVQEQLLDSMALLERALVDSPDDSRDRLTWLADVESQLESALAKELDNPIAHWLMADCQYHRMLLARGDASEVQDRKQQFQAYLDKAWRFRDRLSPQNAMRAEIEAEYLLFRQRNVRSALERYRSILGGDVHSGDGSRLRAHWMLAGMLRGDWGVAAFAPGRVDLEASRNHMLSILAHWPKSPQAQHFAGCVVSDDSQQAASSPLSSPKSAYIYR